MDWVTISTHFNPSEAELMRSRLEASGFLVSLKGLDAALTTDGYSLATGGIHVQVPEDQVAEARGLLSATAVEEEAAE